VTNGRDLELLPVAQDHKRLLEGETGPNTGGMGAYSPVALAGPALLEVVKRDILHPTLEGLRRNRTPFSGVLYAGLMVDAAGAPWVVEFNCRLGDPETQVILPLIGGGLTDSFRRVAAGQAPTKFNPRRGAAVTTVLASRGYPDRAEKGALIKLPHTVPDGIMIFHAGTVRGADGALRVAGGRVLAATGVAPSFPSAQALSRQAADSVEFEGRFFRRDIGWREAARLEERAASVHRA
jgi:phosphoribosylamine--glycine ligase